MNLVESALLGGKPRYNMEDSEEISSSIST